MLARERKGLVGGDSHSGGEFIVLIPSSCKWKVRATDKSFLRMQLLFDQPTQAAAAAAREAHAAAVATLVEEGEARLVQGVADVKRELNKATATSFEPVHIW
jgi:hypothetical protein